MPNKSTKPESVFIQMNISGELKKKFHIHCIALGVSMTQRVQELIEKDLKENKK